MNPKVDFYFDKAKKWQEEINKMRKIVLGVSPGRRIKMGLSLLYIRKKEHCFNTRI